jgi:hypothetical protein
VCALQLLLRSNEAANPLRKHQPRLPLALPNDRTVVRFRRRDLLRKLGTDAKNPGGEQILQFTA